MPVKHVYAKSAGAARRKATGKTVVVTRVRLLHRRRPKHGMRCYSVTTRRKILHTRRGWRSDIRKQSRESWETYYRRKHPFAHMGFRTPRMHKRRRSRKAAMKKAWKARKRRYGRTGFSAAGRRKIIRNLRKRWR